MTVSEQVSAIVGKQVLVYLVISEKTGEVYGPYVFRYTKTDAEMEQFLRGEIPSEEFSCTEDWQENLTVEEALCEVRA